jgi:hypothetical protein
MSRTPGFYIRGVKTAEVLRIADLPGPLLNPFTFSLALPSPAAFLAFSHPRIRLKKSPAQGTLLLNPIGCFHEISVTESKRKIPITGGHQPVFVLERIKLRIHAG